MKVILNQAAHEKINKSKGIAKRFERYLLKSSFFALLLLASVQIMLFNPAFRTAVSEDNRLEGELLTNEAYLFIPCGMKLTLTNIDSCPELKVLVNGEVRDAFNSSEVTLDLKYGDVVELDAGSILEKATVRVSAVSGNIPGILGKTLTVTDGINLIARVMPENR